MGERLTWQKIVEKYPNCYVALVGIVFDGAGITTAIVLMCSTDDKIGSNDTELRKKGISAS